jgi:hypothetical protein
VAVLVVLGLQISAVLVILSRLALAELEAVLLGKMMEVLLLRMVSEDQKGRKVETGVEFGFDYNAIRCLLQGINCLPPLRR